MENIEFWCGDGFAGRSYYMLINGIKIPLCTNLGDPKEAIKNAENIFKAFNAEIPKEIIFKHDGWM